MSARFVVITSIFRPTEAVEKFSRIPGWTVVVVGDRKTDPAWNHPGVEYISAQQQESMDMPLSRAMPWNTYTRKNVGYLVAISRGAEVVYDTDDDNIPLEGWVAKPRFDGAQQVLRGAPYANVYSLFTERHVWPRGFPLLRILEKPQLVSAPEDVRVGVWQYLADEDPDVDAIYRLTDNTPIYFGKRPPVVLARDVVCPFNSQNTYFRREVFPLLYLPSTVTFRFTDILRGLIAQPILWAAGFRVGFGEATVVQRRNPHDYLRDFESEVPVYLLTEKVVEAVKDAIVDGAPVADNLLRAYRELERRRIVAPDELRLLDLWLEGIARR